MMENGPDYPYVTVAVHVHRNAEDVDHEYTCTVSAPNAQHATDMAETFAEILASIQMLRLIADGD